MGIQTMAASVTVVASQAPAARTASNNGTGVDLAGYEGALVAIEAGAWTDGAFAFKLQESDDDSTYTDVAAEDIVGTMPTIDAADEDLVFHTVDYRGNKRYIRVVATVTGTPATGMVFSSWVMRHAARHNPVDSKEA